MQTNEATRITSRDQLIAGILYCLFTREYDYERDEEYDRDNALAYWNGYEFIRENGDVTHADWDFVIAQSTRPDPQYISEQQLATFGGKLIDRAEADRLHLAQWRAECAARGVVVRP